MSFTRCFLKDELKTKICKVVFTKVSGEERIMICTLREDQLPVVEEKEASASQKPVNESVLRVFDLDKKEWRSFKIDSVKSCEEVTVNV